MESPGAEDQRHQQMRAWPTDACSTLRGEKADRLVQARPAAGARLGRPRRQPATVQRGVAQCRLQQQMDGTATTPPDTNATATDGAAAASRSACPVSVPAATASQRPSARPPAHAARIYDSSWRHMPAIYMPSPAARSHDRAQHGMHACCRRGAAGSSSRTVQCASACLPSHRAGDRCSPRCGGGGLLVGIDRGSGQHAYIHACRYSPLAFGCCSDDFFLHYYFREHPPRHRCLICYCMSPVLLDLKFRN